MDLKKLVKELNETAALAATDLEAVPWQTKPSITNMVQDAKARLGALRSEYVTALRSNSMGLFLVGDSARVEEFARIAREETGLVVVKASTMYERLAAPLEPGVGPSREFGIHQFHGLLEGLRLMCKELDVTRMNMPKGTDNVVVADGHAVVGEVRRLVNVAVGNDLLRIYLNKQINEQAMADEFSGKTLPVAILSAEATEIPDLLPLFTSASTVSVGTSEDGEINKEYVLNQLTLAKKSRTKPSN